MCVVVGARPQRWKDRGLAGQLFKGLGTQGKELCRQRHITGRGPGKCQNKMCWLRLEMKIHSWLPQANLFTSQRPAQAEGLVTESDLQHRGQHPPPFPVLTASGSGTGTPANTMHGLAPLPDSASGSTRTIVSSGTLTRVEELFQPVLNLIPIHTLE